MAMSEPKSFASLSSGLLARKGAAKPAMRPQGFGQLGTGIEDLGWNDMGFAPPAPAPAEPINEDDRPAHTPSKITALTPSPKQGPGEDEQLDEIGIEEHFEAAPPVVEQQRAAIAASFGGDAVSEPIAHEPEAEAIEPELLESELFEAEAQAEPVVFEPVIVPAPVVQVKVKAAPSITTIATNRAEPLTAERGRAAFTLRLDAHRHLKLRLACAVTHRSAQQIVTEAVDGFLNSLPELDALAATLPAKAGRRS